MICSIFIKTSYGGASLYILKKETHWKIRTVMEGSTYWGSEENRSEGPNLDNYDTLLLYHWENLVAVGGPSTHHEKHTITKHM